MPKVLQLAIVALGFVNLIFCGEIHNAVVKGELEKVKELVEGGANIDEIYVMQREGPVPTCPGCKLNFNVDDGATAIMFAIKAEHEDIVDYLLEKGAKLDIARTDGWTPLHYAANHGNFKVAKAVMDQNLPVDPLMPAVNATPLHFAAFKGHHDIVSLLLKNGADPNIAKKGGKTALYESAERGDLETVKELVEHGAKIAVFTIDSVSPFHIAVIKGNYFVVEYFLEKGIDPNLERNDNALPIHDAAVFGRTNILKSLLERGAISKINTKTADDITPLQAAVWENRLEAVETLISYGAEFDENILRFVRRDEAAIFFRIFFEQPPSQWGPSHWRTFIAFYTLNHKVVENRQEMLKAMRDTEGLRNREECISFLRSAVAGDSKEKAQEKIQAIQTYLADLQKTRSDALEMLHAKASPSLLDQVLGWFS